MSSSNATSSPEKMPHESVISILNDLSPGWQVVIHRCPRSLHATFKEIFPDLRALPAADSEADLLFVAFWQQTKMDMSGFSDPVEEERFAKTTTFIEAAKRLAENVKSRCSNKANWFDFIDPSSGLPFLGQRGNSVFIETDDAVNSLGYELLEFGCCQAVSHELWSTKCFLGPCLTTLAPEEIAEAIQETFKS